MHCRSIDELEALHEELLSLPDVQHMQSPVLSARLANPSDTVAAVLSKLHTAEPAALWQLLQTEPAKSHPRWVELAARVVEAAVQRGFDAPLEAWSKAIADRVRALGKAPPPLAFRRMNLEAQMDLAPETQLSATQDAEARERAVQMLGGTQPADDAPELVQARADMLAALRRRDAAARVLQARLPPYIKRLRDRRASTAARRSAQAWLAHASAMRARAQAHAALQAAAPDDALQALQTYAQAAQMALRARAGALVLNVTAEAWDAAQALLAKTPSLLQTQHAAAQWKQRADGSAGSADPLWTCVALPASTGRVIAVLLFTLLELLQALRDGSAVMHPDASSLEKVQQAMRKPSQSSHNAADAPEASQMTEHWWPQHQELDMRRLNTLVCAGLNTLAQLQRPHTVLQLGRDWRALSCQTFDDRLLPILTSAAQLAGEEDRALAAALAASARNASVAQRKLRAARAAASALCGGANADLLGGASSAVLGGAAPEGHPSTVGPGR